MPEYPPLESASLQRWLEKLEQRSPEAEIKLGLERVHQVLGRLVPDFSDIKIITVGGTNGKGSAVRFLESIYTTAGYSCLAYTSPHLLTFAERFRLNGENIHDQAIVESLAAVERARDEIALTYFEHITLAAFHLADRLRPSVLLLEVGLGGRLDAVNAVDADVAIITSIGLDHQAWLGNTRAKIAREKAGIARAGKPLILAEKKIPEGMLETLSAHRADVRLAGRAFDWRWSGQGVSVNIRQGQTTLRFNALQPGIRGRHQSGNAAAALAAVAELQNERPVNEAAIRSGIANARLPGRFQQVLQQPACYVDVAHNPASVRALRAQLESSDGAGFNGTTRAVFAALRDKNIAAIVRVLADQIDHWYIAGLNGPRALPVDELQALIATTAVQAPLDALKSVPEALDRALADARRAKNAQHDRIVVFGSFITAAAAIRHLKHLTG